MKRKLVALAGAGALLLTMAGPAFGWGWGGWGSDELTVRNSAYVYNNVETEAETGENSVGGMFVLGGGIHSGDAGATTLLSNDVNFTGVACDCYDDVTIYNRARVSNRVETEAETGENSVGGMFVGGGWIHSGNAGATSMVSNFVNTTLVGP